MMTEALRPFPPYLDRWLLVGVMVIFLGWILSKHSIWISWYTRYPYQRFYGMTRNLTKRSFLEALFIGIIIALTFWGYFGTLDDFFIMDDFDMIRGHSNFGQFVKHWSSPVGANSYRPLIDLLFIWDFYWWEWNPIGWHLSDVLFHILNSVLVYFLAQRVSRNVCTAFVAGVLFGLHTSHTEAVTWISARMDVVCTTFFLVSVLGFISFLQKRSSKRFTLLTPSYILSLFSFAGGLFIKEMVVTLPGILMLYDAVFCTSRRIGKFELWKKLKIYTPYAVVLFAYFLLRANALSGSEEYHSWGTRVRDIIGGYNVQLFGMFIFKNIVMYFKFLSIPFVKHIFSGSVLWYNLLGIGIFSAICIALSRESRFAVMWIFITLLPVMSFSIGRGVYLASAGFCILAGTILTFSFQQSECHTRSFLNIRSLRYILRGLQVLIILVVFYRYAGALQISNAWWGQIAETNKNVPLMIHALRPTFPRGSIVCIQNVTLVPNQRFNNAFHFRFSDVIFGGVYMEDLDDCAERRMASVALTDIYFFYYKQGIMYDLTLETRNSATAELPPTKKKLLPPQDYTLSQQRSALTIGLDLSVPYSAIGIVGSLTNAIDIPQGTIVARARIEFDDGGSRTVELVAGEDTAEWAIRYPHLQAAAQHASPQAYRSWTAKQKDGTFTSAQNYRKIITFPVPRRLVKIEFERPSDLAHANVSVVLDRLMLYPNTPEQQITTATQ
ncbi:MAG: hypothetical protein GY801_26200 [bacterium]|nr:hypothetical protein [bacterium]